MRNILQSIEKSLNNTLTATCSRQLEAVRFLHMLRLNRECRKN